MTLVVAQEDAISAHISTKNQDIWRGFAISTLDKPATCEIVQWRYEPPYDIYNLEELEGTIKYLLDEQNKFHALRDRNGELVGFCSFGADAQVPGGNYGEDALDIGMGIRPDMTGKGWGSKFAAAVLEFAQQKFDPINYRVTIAAFNQRAQRVWKNNGFQHTQTFIHEATSREFVVLMRAKKHSKNRDF